MGAAASAEQDRNTEKRNKLSKPKIGNYSSRKRETVVTIEDVPARRNSLGFIQKPSKSTRKRFSFREKFSQTAASRVSIIEPIPERHDTYFDDGRLDTPSPVRAYTLHNPESPRVNRRISLIIPPREPVTLEPAPPSIEVARRRSQILAPMPASVTRRSVVMPIYEPVPEESSIYALDLATERVQTPSGYSVIGTFKRGSLRIVNGAASPAPSTTTGAPSIQASIRDLSPSAASVRTFVGRPSPYGLPVNGSPLRGPTPRIIPTGEPDTRPVESGSYFTEILKQAPPILRRSQSADSIHTARTARANSPFSFVASPRVEPEVFSKVSAVDDYLFDDPAVEKEQSDREDGEEGEGGIYDERGYDEEEEDGNYQYGVACSDIAEDGSTMGQERSPSVHIPAMVYRMASNSTAASSAHLSPVHVRGRRHSFTHSPLLSPALSDISSTSAASLAYHEAVAAEVREKVIRLTESRSVSSPVPPIPPPKPAHMQPNRKSGPVATRKPGELIRSKKGSDSGYSTASSNNSVRVKRKSRHVGTAASSSRTSEEKFYTPPAQPERQDSFFSKDGDRRRIDAPRITVQTDQNTGNSSQLDSPLPDSGISPSTSSPGFEFQSLPPLPPLKPLTLEPLRPLSPIRLPSFDSLQEEKLTVPQPPPKPRSPLAASPRFISSPILTQKPDSPRRKHVPPPLRLEPQSKERRVLGRVSSNSLSGSPHLFSTSSPRSPASPKWHKAPKQVLTKERKRHVIAHQKSLPALPFEKKTRTRVSEIPASAAIIVTEKESLRTSARHHSAAYPNVTGASFYMRFSKGKEHAHGSVVF